ncbi:hypothetical protein BOO30_16885 [Vibrio navarrensis]|nr:hypothetical protein [Vibrio navarrensis]MBE4598044.1 hypothetical protein [Vibrio navarrensis]
MKAIKNKDTRPELVVRKLLHGHGFRYRVAPAWIAGKDVYTISDKLWEGHQKRKTEHQNKGNGFGYSLFNAESEYTNTISARYYKDGSEILIDQSDIGKKPVNLRRANVRDCRASPRILLSMPYLMANYISILVTLYV